MPRTAATLTQADVARVLRAARQAGAGEVEVRPDGTILVRMMPSAPRPEHAERPDDPVPVAERRRIVL